MCRKCLYKFFDEGQDKAISDQARSLTDDQLMSWAANILYQGIQLSDGLVDTIEGGKGNALSRLLMAERRAGNGKKSTH